MEAKLRVKGKVKFEVKDKDGRVVRTIETENLIVNWGLTALTDYIAGNAPGVPVTHIAVGDGQTPVQPTDTALEN